MLGGNGFRDVLEIRHGDRLSLEILRIGVKGHDISEVASTRELSGGAMTGKEHEHAIVALNVLRIRQRVAQHGHDLFARGLLVQKSGEVIRLGAELSQKN